MNLHAIAGPAVSIVNPTTLATLLVSTGYTTGSDGTRTPSYSATDNVPVQVQALSAREIEHLDSINIQNVSRAAYINGNVEGLDRASAKGGDLLIFDGATWLVVQVLETWSASGWCKVALSKQTT